MNLNQMNQLCDEGRAMLGDLVADLPVDGELIVELKAVRAVEADQGGTTSVSSANGQSGPDGAGPSQNSTLSTMSSIPFQSHCFCEFLRLFVAK